MRIRNELVFILGVLFLNSAPGASTASFENYLVPSWGDLVWVYGPGTDPALDTPEALERMFKLWQARGYTGIHLRTDLAQLDPSMIRRNPPKMRNPKYDVIWKYIDSVSDRFDVHEYGPKLSEPLGFQFWAWHPYIYSDGAPEDAGSPGKGRIWPWSYVDAYTYNHQEIVTVDRRGNKYWMVREFAYPGARASKAAEFVHMAKKYHLKYFISCMRSESSQVQDPPDRADRYGFNAPVVADMKRLYGVDIMTDPRFDVDNPKFDPLDPMVEEWHDLRGSYVTQFYRDLRQALNEVDPGIKLGVTLSGDHVGPPLGNWRLDWRKWVDEGLIDVIFTPVFFEATLDLQSDKKGYLTDVKKGKGTVSCRVLKDYIRKSAHPGIKVIVGGGGPYEFYPPPDGADGWRAGDWNSSYHVAWYQRWQQWKKDLKELGFIKFFEQSFDNFPLDNNGYSGGWGDARYFPSLHACPGCWLVLGDGKDAKPVAQEAIRHGSKGRAMRLTRAADGRGKLIGWHASAPDRSSFVWCLDNCITGGQATFEYWLYRANKDSSLSAFLQDAVAAYSQDEIEGQRDVGLQVAPETGRLLYTRGTNWTESTYALPVGQWQKFTIKVDLDARRYSAYAGTDAAVTLCRDIPLENPKKRFIEEAGVNIPIEMTAYKLFNQVLFVPEGKDGNVTYLDDVSVRWIPSMYYVEPGRDVYFSDDFETHEARKSIDLQPGVSGGKWKVTPGAADTYYVDNNTSFGEGVNCLHSRGGAEVVVIGERPLNLTSAKEVTIDLDVFIRSDKSYPNMLPNPLTKSRHRTALGLKTTDAAQPVLGVYAGDGTWQYWDRDKYVNSNTKIAYDVWNHLQMAFDTAAGTYQVVVQPVGEVPTQIVKGVRATGTTDVRFVISPSKSADHTSLYDNVVIATRSK